MEGRYMVFKVQSKNYVESINDIVISSPMGDPHANVVDYRGNVLATTQMMNGLEMQVWFKHLEEAKAYIKNCSRDGCLYVILPGFMMT